VWEEKDLRRGRKRSTVRGRRRSTGEGGGGAPARRRSSSKEEEEHRVGERRGGASVGGGAPLPNETDEAVKGTCMRLARAWLQENSRFGRS
jgi:hypothetical protein